MKSIIRHNLPIALILLGVSFGMCILSGCSFLSYEKEVKVLDNKNESIPGTDFEDFSLTTHYRYDDSGKLISSEQSTNYPEANINLCRSSFEYDNQGRLNKVSNSFEQYDWNVGNTEEFEYDDSGKCLTYISTVTSQGTGIQQYSYEYDSSGVIVSGSVESYLGPQDIEGVESLSWSYMDNGLIRSVSSSGTLGFALDEGLSNESLRTFCYEDKYGITSVLYFDEEGLLIGVDTTSSTGTQRTTYEYKTIVVDSRDYIPTVYSNPTGFGVQWKPQYSEHEISNIIQL